MTPAARATRSLIVATALAWLLRDLVVALAWGRAATISHAMWAWSLEYRWFGPAVTAAAAALCFHFFVGFDAILGRTRSEPVSASRRRDPVRGGRLDA